MKKEEIKLTKLKEKKEELENKLFDEQIKEHEKFNNCGWGCNMRGYSKVSKLNFSKSEKLEKRIEEIEKKIEILENIIAYSKAV